MAIQMASFALDQYLRIASKGNVSAQHAFNVDRWQLVCHKCEEKLTFASGWDIADGYTNRGTMDQSVSKFCEAHQHGKMMSHDKAAVECEEMKVKEMILKKAKVAESLASQMMTENIVKLELIKLNSELAEMATRSVRFAPPPIPKDAIKKQVKREGRRFR